MPQISLFPWLGRQVLPLDNVLFMKENLHRGVLHGKPQWASFKCWWEQSVKNKSLWKATGGLDPTFAKATTIKGDTCVICLCNLIYKQLLASKKKKRFQDSSIWINNARLIIVGIILLTCILLTLAFLFLMISRCQK